MIKEIKELNEIARNRKVFIIGSGCSALLAKGKNLDGITIGVNHAYRNFETHYNIYLDDYFLKEVIDTDKKIRKKESKENPEIKLDKYKFELSGDWITSRSGSNVDKKPGVKFKFSPKDIQHMNIEEGVYCPGQVRNTGLAALSVALYMWAKEIYLVGFDYKDYTEYDIRKKFDPEWNKGDASHFSDHEIEHRWKSTSDKKEREERINKYNQTIIKFEPLKKFASKYGIQIYNTNKDSMLKTFRYSDIFQNDTIH